jgi:AcrR family transcriptional regulator
VSQDIDLRDGRPAASGSTVGRPRDDAIDAKVTVAAVDLYAREGWGRFTFEAVARLAGVGKPAIYLRYSSKEELLVSSLAALNRVDDEITDEINTGRLRTDLAQYVREAFDFWLSPLGTATLRMKADGVYLPELGAMFHERVVRKKVQRVRRIVERAKARGELPVTVDTNIFLESLDGAVLNRVVDTRLASRLRLREIVNDYADALVRLLLDETVVDAAQN